MGYEDFVHFILSEEDKSSAPSQEYWYVADVWFNAFFNIDQCSIFSVL